MMWDRRVGRLAMVFCSLSLLLAVPVCVHASRVGVEAGDWWEYGLGLGFESNNLNATMPPGMDTAPAWYRMSVKEVSGTTVSLDMIIGFRNGTQIKGQAAGDLLTGTGNLTLFLFPAGLSKGDWPWGTGVPHDIGAAYVNDTVSRAYAGAIREVNVIEGTQAFGGTEITMVIIFDKMTGIVCEFSQTMTSTQGDWVTIVSSSMELSQTNAWRVVPIPEIGGMAGIVGLGSALLGHVMWRMDSRGTRAPRARHTVPWFRRVVCLRRM